MARNSAKPKDEATLAVVDEQGNASPTPATEEEQGNANPVPPVEDQAAAGASPRPTGEDNTTYAPIKLVLISVRGLALRERPGKQFAMLAVLPTGTVLTGREADETAEGWIAVQTKAGKAGYVDTCFVTVVD